jgi:precorrin-6B methylase 2
VAGRVWHERLPSPLPVWLGTTRRLVQHPTALLTINDLFGARGSGAPWWNRRAIRYLSERLRPGDRVFEWGSGASTVWLIKQDAVVTSIEDDPKWVANVRSSCPEADVRLIEGAATGTTMGYQATMIDSSRPFYDDYVAAIDEFPDDSFDVIIVDGQSRAECVQRAVPKVKPGGLLIIDDSDMRALWPVKRSLPGWKRASLAGFKSTHDLRETTFFRRPN